MRGTAGFGAMLAAGRRPRMMCFCTNETQQRSMGSSLGTATTPPWAWEGTPALVTQGSSHTRRSTPPPAILKPHLARHTCPCREHHIAALGGNPLALPSSEQLP